MSYEQSHLISKLPFTPRFIIFDESTRLKSARRSGNAGHANKWLKLARKCGRVWLMTAEPMPQNCEDAYGQSLFVETNRDTALFGTLDAFRETYRTPHPHVKNVYSDQHDAVSRVTSVIVPHCVMMAPPQVTLPDFQEVRFSLGSEQKHYAQLQRARVLTGYGVELVPANPAVLAAKLLQISSGFVYVDNADPHTLGNARLAALRELLATITGECVLISYTYIESASRIAYALGARLLTKPRDFDDWNAGRVPIALVHPKSCGHGLDLQHGGRRLIIYETIDSYDLHYQLIERLGPRRQASSGYDRQVIVHSLIADGTLDDTRKVRREGYENFITTLNKETN
jgi:hypothetical protein